ncbi:MAG: uracil-DNA glycosylase [Pseudomonadota bacterium]
MSQSDTTPPAAADAGGDGSASSLSPVEAFSQLAFLVECGADEAISTRARNRFDEATAPQEAAAAMAAAPPSGRADRPPTDRAMARSGPPPAPPAPALSHGAGDERAGHQTAETEFEHIASAHSIAAGCDSLASLRDAIAAFDGCSLKRGARTCVFADGSPAARLMIIGEAPGREEDQRGLPFVGRSGQLLDRMLAAIGMARDHPDPGLAVYITNVLPWRPPQNREPSSDEIAMMKAFLLRHIKLADPEFLLLMGRSAASTLLETATGITRLRGQWHRVLDRPALPTFHPAALLRNPLHKRLVWADLLALQDRLEQTR